MHQKNAVFTKAQDTIKQALEGVAQAQESKI